MEVRARGRRPRLLLAHTVPTSRTGRSFALHEEAVGHPPLNLLALATYARSAGIDVVVADLALAASPDEVLDQHLTAFRPDVVGFGCTTPTVDSVLSLSARCRGTGARVVAGGAGAVCDPSALLGCGDVDAIVHGEGEEPLVELVHGWAAGKDADAIDGVQTAASRRPRPRARRRSLDATPRVDFGFIDMAPYVRAEALGLVTSRGCPYACHFCACPRLWTTSRVTSHSVERLLEILDDLVVRFEYDGRLVTFFDDTFTLDPRRVRAVCEALEKRPYRVRWKVMTRVDRVEPELLQLMRRAGCVHVSFGIEATRDEDLRRLNKRITMEQVRRAIECARDAGLFTEGYFLMGLPWHRKETLVAAIDEAYALGLDVTRFSCLAPYPGTFFHENAASLGIRVPIPDRWRFTGSLPVVESDGFSLADHASALARYLTRALERDEAVSDAGADDRDGDPQPAPFPAHWQVSPHLVDHRAARGTLVFEYLNGSYAFLNDSALEVLALSRVHRTIPELHRAMTARYGTVDRRDVEESVRRFHELGFIDAG